MDPDAYLVKIEPRRDAPDVPPVVEVEAPHEARRRPRPRWGRLAVMAAAAALLFVHADTIWRLGHDLMGKAEQPVVTFQADRDLRRAGAALDAQWAHEGTYAATVADLAQYDASVRWGDVVRFRPCFGGLGAVLTATTAGGERSVLYVRGSSRGTVAGDHPCPVGPDDLDPWGDLSF